MKKYFLTLSGLLLASCDDMIESNSKAQVLLKAPVAKTVAPGVVQADKAESEQALVASQKVYQTSLECEDGDVYKISMSETGENFSVYLNNELLVSSKDMTEQEKEATKEIALQMVENLRLIEGAEDFLSQNSTSLRFGTYRQTKRNTLQLPRMKSRIRSSKERLLENVTEMMHILIECEENPVLFLQETGNLKFKVTSRRAKMMSHAGNLRQNEG